MTNKRNGKRWTVNECLQLQREYELLQLSIEDIASLHQRTTNAIIYKLELEGFMQRTEKINQENNIFENKDTLGNIDKDSIDDDNDDDSGSPESLKQHINRLEQQISILSKLIMSQYSNKAILI